MTAYQMDKMMTWCLARKITAIMVNVLIAKHANISFKNLFQFLHRCLYHINHRRPLGDIKGKLRAQINSICPLSIMIPAQHLIVIYLIAASILGCFRGEELKSDK